MEEQEILVLTDEDGNELEFELIGSGEVDGVSHDVGIVYADKPFVVAFTSSEVDAGQYNCLIASISKRLFDAHGGEGASEEA